MPIYLLDKNVLFLNDLRKYALDFQEKNKDKYYTLEEKYVDLIPSYTPTVVRNGKQNSFKANDICVFIIKATEMLIEMKCISSYIPDETKSISIDFLDNIIKVLNKSYKLSYDQCNVSKSTFDYNKDFNYFLNKLSNEELFILYYYCKAQIKNWHTKTRVLDDIFCLNNIKTTINKILTKRNDKSIDDIIDDNISLMEKYTKSNKKNIKSRGK